MHKKTYILFLLFTLSGQLFSDDRIDMPVLSVAVWNEPIYEGLGASLDFLVGSQEIPLYFTLGYSSSIDTYDMSGQVPNQGILAKVHYDFLLSGQSEGLMFYVYPTFIQAVYFDLANNFYVPAPGGALGIKLIYVTTEDTAKTESTALADGLSRKSENNILQTGLFLYLELGSVFPLNATTGITTGNMSPVMMDLQFGLGFCIF
jgi:hypothetical protein